MKVFADPLVQRRPGRRFGVNFGSQWPAPQNIVVMNKNRWTISKAIFLAAVAVAIAVDASGAPEPGHQFKLPDFPPSPFAPSLAAAPWPKKPDSLLESVEEDLERSSASTNSAELALAVEVKTLKSKVTDLEAALNARDPMRRVYGRYVETAHDWVVKNHQREFGLANQYFASNALPAQQRALNSVVQLVDMALYKDLAGNTNFTPLFKSVFELFERKRPGFLGGNYARNDALIGFHPPAPPKAVTTFEEYLTELDQRYDLVLAKLEQIQRDEAIPTDVIMGWMYGDLYRMLDGSAQYYVMLSTPEEVEKLRQDLHYKSAQLRTAQVR